MRVRRFCVMEGCVGPRVGFGYCRKHYTRWRNHGDPEATAFIRGDDRARFEGYVERTEDCWYYTGADSGQGYRSFQCGRRSIKAHRYAYELWVGPIPAGFQIDHLCRRKCCVNPDHLEVVSAAEHGRRQLARTHCYNGHDLLETAYTYANGNRTCTVCRNQYRRKWRAARTAAGLKVS